MMETIILAGGLGTRLKAVTKVLPKPMAPIASKPFLALLLDHLICQNVNHAILSVGYKYEAIVSYFGDRYRDCKLTYSIEREPLGTGGAIRYALQQVESEYVLVMNGDTLFQVPFCEMIRFHQSHQADLTLALKPMVDFARYGNVVLSNTQIVGFEEKQYCVQGNINGGIYLMKKEIFEAFSLPPQFSFETDFMKEYVNQLHVYGFVCDGYFIDIGIPEDYRKAQQELKVNE